MRILAEVKHFENNHIYFQNCIVYMVAVKVFIRKRFNTRKINAWLRKNGRKITELALAGLITAPVLILLVKYLKDGTLSTVEKKTIVNTIEKIDNIPENNRVLVIWEPPTPDVIPVTEKPNRTSISLFINDPLDATKMKELNKQRQMVKSNKISAVQLQDNVVKPTDRTAKFSKNIIDIGMNPDENKSPGTSAKNTEPLSVAVPLQDITPKQKGTTKSLASLRSVPSVILPVNRVPKNTRNNMRFVSDKEAKKIQRMPQKTGSSPSKMRRSSA